MGGIGIGMNIAKARKARGMTQEQLAQRLNVSFQAVSTWERDGNLPDTAHLRQLAEALDTSLDALLNEKVDRDWELRSPVFDAAHMYTYVKAKAQAGNFPQTLAALPVMREKHAGQTRRSRTGNVPYAVHPLMLACHALAMGIAEDDVLAALLLHDVVEDTGTRLEELPVSEQVREAVRLVSHNSYDGCDGDADAAYYAGIVKNPLAALVKCIDRCNNLSSMADGFSREEMAGQVIHTEQHVLPLLDVVKNMPRWNNAAWLLRYQMMALMEAFKRIL